MNPYFYHIGQYDWDFFCTLTYCPDNFYTDPFDCRVGQGRRRKALFSFLRHVAAQDRVHFKKLQWVVREETGEAFGRPHHHLLLRNIQQNKHKTKHHTRYLEQYWWRQTQSMSRVRQFHKWIDGAKAYMVKAANGYEQRKFGEAISVEFSEAFQEHILNNQTYDVTQQEMFPRSSVFTG